MNFINRTISKLERKFSKYAIGNLMYYIVGGMIAVFAVELIFTYTGTIDGLSMWLSFDRDLILQGQVWRIISFIFIPPNASILWIVFSLYFFYMIGHSLEGEWGSAMFNIYYFIGIIGTIIAGFIIGYTTNFYLNMSLFFAFAVLYPNTELMLFFFIPVKIKYLAYIDAAFFIISFIFGTWSAKIAILAALLNFILFFGKDFYARIKLQILHIQSRRRFNSKK